MNKITNLKKGVKAKDYRIKQFNGFSLRDDRVKWLEENPEIIIFNTHIYIDSQGCINHIFEYIK